MARGTIKRTRAGNVQGENLTLDFDASIVSPEVFKRAISAFLDLLKAVSEEVVESGKKIQWNIGVANGSNLTVARPVPDAETARASHMVIQVLPDGLRRLQRGTPTAPLYFNERALHAARELAAMRDDGMKGLDYVRVRSSGRPSELGPHLVSNVDRLLGGYHQAFGSIEGKLQTLTERGTLQFVVYDSLYDKGVNCFMDDKIVQQAIDAFRKRVAVTGMVQYDREGRPVSIRVEKIRIFKDIQDLPPIHSLRGIFVKAE